MANLEHLAILKQGVEVWNEWRRNNRNIMPDLSNGDMSEKNLIGIDLQRAFLDESDFSGSNLTSADLTQAILPESIFIKANLSNANFLCALLNDAYLAKAKLIGTNLVGANLISADLSHTILREADLGETNLYRASVDEANFAKATVGGTNFGDVDLSTARGLEAVKHDGPSSLGIDTIYRSKGNIPEVFLRGCGVPDTFIEFSRSLVGKPIEFNSCFISYSSKDQAFAERIHSDLRAKGVRVWFAPENLKAGDKFRGEIDKAIRIYDKLLIVLSQSSIASQWVEKEVETAFEKERRENRIVLFPIRLDDAVMKTVQAWAADIRRTRHISDFSRWENHNSYQAAFERLLRDLKAAAPGG